MRQSKHAQSRNRREKSQPTPRRVGRCKLRNEERRYPRKNERQNTKAGRDMSSSAVFRRPRASYNLFAAGMACIFVAYEVPTDRKHNKHDLCNSWCHFGFDRGAGFVSGSLRDGGTQISAPSSPIIEMAPSAASV
jgi:hypothetical protein